MQSRAERLAPLTGVGFLIFYIVGFVVVGSTPDFMDSPAANLKYYVANDTDAMLGGMVLLLAAVFLLWFLGSIRRVLSMAEGGDGRVTAIGFAGGTVGVALLVAGLVAFVLPAARFDEQNKLDSITATVFTDLSNGLMGIAAPISLGILLVATAVVGIRHGAFPKVWSWFTALLGVIMLIPLISWAGMFFLFPIWVLVMVVMLMRGGARDGAPAAGSASA
jgi:hypothetical protein